MNGFEQIKSFYSWVFNNPDKVKPTHISLYLFLLNQNNRAMWVEWFKCPFDLAMQGACIGSKSTYYKCLDDLQNYKLIKYEKGLNNYKAPKIKLIKLYKNEPLTEQVTVPLSEPLTEQLSVPLTGNIYKLITNNINLINENEKKFIEFVESLKVKNEFMTETQFIEYWKKCRMEYDKNITNIDKLEFHERQIFDRIKSEYTIERITDAVAGMFMQKNMFPALRLRPKHFLENFTKYLDCWDNNIQLFKDDKKDNFKQDKL